MSEKRWVVTVDDAERTYLKDLISKGKRSAPAVIGAQVLLKAAEGWADTQIAEALPVCVRTVERLRRRSVEEGVEAALQRRKQLHRKAARLDGAGEARLITLACSKPPDRRARWTLRLLAGQLIELKVVPSISHETVRQTLKKTLSSRGRSGSGVSRRGPTRHSSARWKTSSMSTTGRMIRRGR